ncbi:MAG: ABC transporter ATP-binding protein [Actinomycetota bacterium]|nr:ABC transporter ATP-binding protein [Actinomycetota bacterium]
MPAILIEDLKKHYGEVKAVDGINLEVEEGEIFGILGPNGAGKTTTLEMVETLRKPDSGRIQVLGMDVGEEPKAIKESIGVQLQTTVFFDKLKVRETIDLFCSFYPRTLSVDKLIDIATLGDKADAMVSDLSGGQHKRLSIALALVNDPRIVFLDEPTTGLDPQARRRIWEIVEGLRDEEKTVVITTHYIEEAEYLCDRVAVMDHGRIVAWGTPDDLIDEYVSDGIITFRLTRPVEEGIIEKIEGVKSLSRRDDEYMVITPTPQKTLLSIFAMAHDQGVEADDVNMKRATLEDVFLKITGRRIRE